MAEELRRRLAVIGKRLETHNRLEEERAYAWPHCSSMSQRWLSCVERLRHELENLPPRFAETVGKRSTNSHELTLTIVRVLSCCFVDRPKCCAAGTTTCDAQNSAIAPPILATLQVIIPKPLQIQRHNHCESLIGASCFCKEAALETTTRFARGEGLKTEKMPGHWVLARLGKRVLRPGGMQLTRRMLNALQIQHTDDVIEFAPGMGVTARLTLQLEPKSYTAVERDQAAAKLVAGYLKGARQQCVVGDASNTGLPNNRASVVYGEAMLTMQTQEIKCDIVREAHRLLKVGGRYGIHEMCLMSDRLDEHARRADREIADRRSPSWCSAAGRIKEWRSLLESEGFEVQSVDMAPMSLLEPGRLIRDEGLLGALRFVWNLLRDSEARQRVLEMRAVFRRNRNRLGAVAIIGIKR